MKKFLLPVDDSIHSTHALQYMAMMAPALKDFIYMIFYVQPTISDYLMEEAKKEPKASEKLKQLEQHNVRLGAEILKRHKEWLMHQNVAEEKIMVVTQRRKEGLARDIIHQAYSELVDAIIIGKTIAEEFRNGRYGTVVVGKRGVSKRFFMGSVSHYLVTHLQNGAL
jgi:nucleotide-binding universal stress UspA family protein